MARGGNIMQPVSLMTCTSQGLKVVNIGDIARSHKKCHVRFQGRIILFGSQMYPCCCHHFMMGRYVQYETHSLTCVHQYENADYVHQQDGV